jgi:hypothetical protein
MKPIRRSAIVAFIFGGGLLLTGAVVLPPYLTHNELYTLHYNQIEGSAESRLCSDGSCVVTISPADLIEETLPFLIDELRDKELEEDMVAAVNAIAAAAREQGFEGRHYQIRSRYGVGNFIFKKENDATGIVRAEYEYKESERWPICMDPGLGTYWNDAEFPCAANYRPIEVADVGFCTGLKQRVVAGQITGDGPYVTNGEMKSNILFNCHFNESVTLEVKVELFEDYTARSE